MKSFLFAACVVFVVIGCTRGVAAPPSPPSPPTSTASSALAPCCESYDELRALDGRRVELVGAYTPTLVRKGLKKEGEDAQARTVAIVEGTMQVMLEVYYAPKGTRSEEEIGRFAGKRVRVVGTLRARTPDRSSEDGVLQTMIGPCVTEIESIELVP